MSGKSFQTLFSVTTGIGTPVQLGTATSASVQTNTLTTINAVPAGGVIFVTACFVKSTTINISTITDTNGNTYQSAVSAGWSATGVENQELWYAVCTSGMSSGATITITLSATPNPTNPWPMAAGYCTGLIATPLDKTSSAKLETGTGAVSSGTTAALTQAKELVIGALGWYASAAPGITEDATFTALASIDGGPSNHLVSRMAYKIVNATTAVSYVPTVASAVSGGVMVATFKGA